MNESRLLGRGWSVWQDTRGGWWWNAYVGGEGASGSAPSQSAATQLAHNAYGQLANADRMRRNLPPAA